VAGVVAVPLALGVIVFILIRLGHDCREWVSAYLARVRRDPQASIEEARGDAERVEAYQAIGQSTSEDVPLVNASHGGGDFSEYQSDVCINATLHGPHANRPLAILVSEHTSHDVLTRKVTDISLRRVCICHGHGKCRLE
jgi:hypothetical protein